MSQTDISYLHPVENQHLFCSCSTRKTQKLATNRLTIACRLPISGIFMSIELLRCRFLLLIGTLTFWISITCLLFNNSSNHVVLKLLKLLVYLFEYRRCNPILYGMQNSKYCWK
jgi:hypothetical protein